MSAKRVDGELAVSRALGDFQYKDALKISDPRNFKVINLSVPDVQALVLRKACDL